MLISIAVLKFSLNKIFNNIYVAFADLCNYYYIFILKYNFFNKN